MCAGWNNSVKSRARCGAAPIQSSGARALFFASSVMSASCLRSRGLIITSSSSVPQHLTEPTLMLHICHSAAPACGKQLVLTSRSRKSAPAPPYRASSVRRANGMRNAAASKSINALIKATCFTHIMQATNIKYLRERSKRINNLDA